MLALCTLNPALGVGMPTVTLDADGFTFVSPPNESLNGSRFVSLQYWVTDGTGRELANSVVRGLDYTRPVHLGALAGSASPATPPLDEDPVGQLGNISPGQWLATWQFPRKVSVGAWPQGTNMMILIEGIPATRPVRPHSTGSTNRFRVTYRNAKRASGTLEVP